MESSTHDTQLLPRSESNVIENGKMLGAYLPSKHTRGHPLECKRKSSTHVHVHVCSTRAAQGHMRSWRLTSELRTPAATFPACSKVLLIALLEQLDAMTSRRLLVAASEEAVAQELGEALRRQRLHARQTRHALQRARLDVRQRRVAGSRRRRADVDARALLRGLLHLQVSRHSFT